MERVDAPAGTGPTFARRMSAYGPVLVNTVGKTSPKMENFSKNDKKITKSYKKATKSYNFSLKMTKNYEILTKNNEKMTKFRKK